MRDYKMQCVCEADPQTRTAGDAARSLKPCVLHTVFADQQRDEARRTALEEVRSMLIAEADDEGSGHGLCSPGIAGRLRAMADKIQTMLETEGAA